MQKIIDAICFSVIFIFFITGCGQAPGKKETPIAQKGVLDLTGWDFETDGNVELKGSYRFAWQRLLNPEECSKRTAGENKDFIAVPTQWNGHNTGGKPASGHGAATYCLTVLLPESPPPLALKISDFSTAADIFVNGKKIYSVGRVSADPALHKPGWRPEVIQLMSPGNAIHMVVHVSNYSHRKGGMWEKLWLGTASGIAHARTRNIAFALFLFGSILTIGLYHLGIFVLRRNERSFLYFGLFCIIITFRLLTTNERYLLDAFPSIPWEIIVKLEYLGFYLAIPAFTLFIDSVFPGMLSRIFCKTVLFIGLLFSTAVVVFPVRLFSFTLPPYEVFTLTLFIYGLIKIIIVSLQKSTFARIFLAGFSILFLTAVNDILFNTNTIQTGNFVPLGLFVFIFSQAFLLSMRYSNAFDTIEKQRLSLRKNNEDLEKEIHERKQAENEAKAFHKRSLTVLDSIDADVYVADMQTYEILFMNRHMKETHANDFTGQICYEAFRKENNVCKDCTNPKLLDGGGRPNAGFLWEGRDSITEKWYSYHDRAIPWDNHRVVRMQVATDITSAKLAEEKLQRINEDLEARVGERTAELVKANDALRQEINVREQAERSARVAERLAEVANQAKSEFLANMSHELRTPLNHILGFTELVLDQHFGTLNKVQKEYLEDVHDSSTHLLSLINDILDLSKIEAGKLVLEPTNFALTAMLNNCMALFKEKAMKHNIDLSASLDSLPERINGDERKIKQIVYNLLSNAVKFTPDGGKVSLAARGFPKERKNIRRIKISVTDTGIGITPKDLNRIFLPFEQVEQTASRRFQGTGLGLSLTRKLVERHEGEIWAESSGPGKGATFHVILLLKACNR